MNKISEKLTSLMKERILIIDGATGTALQDKNLTVEDFGGPALEGCNEYLVITRPDVVKSVHLAYLDAGADIIETNTFGSNKIVLAEYGLAERTRELNRIASQIAKESTIGYSDKFVAGSMGPTTKSIVVTADITFDKMKEAYYEQALGLIEGGSDILFIETGQDTLNMKAALLASQDAMKLLKIDIPIFLSPSILDGGSMLAGQDIEAFYNAMKHADVFAFGMNCAVGPKDMRSHLNTLSTISDRPVFIFPNAGLPNEHGHYDETPESFARHIEGFLDNQWLNIVGGCCGTTPEHIKVLKASTVGKKPRIIGPKKFDFAVSGIELVIPDDKIRPILVGERTNVQGSRLFKNLIREGNFDEAISVAHHQIQNRAQIIDVCLEDTAFDEIEAIHKFYPKLARAVKVPIMIDSTNPVAVEEALKYCQGKAIINSINLESGRERLDQVIPLMKKYGASAVVGVIDEQGMAVSYDRKISVAKKLYDILINEYNLNPSDLIFDMLVFTVDTGKNPEYKGTAEATIKSIKEVKKLFPDIKTILGISNVSFGLPASGREVLNAVFFYHNVQAGLDLAIVNPALIKRYNSLSEEEIQLSEEVIFNKSENALMKFTEYFRGKDQINKEVKPEDTGIKLTPEDFVHRAIVLGDKNNLKEQIDLLLAKYPPLEIISTILMGGMDEVGDLFGQGKLIVTEVLQSAEVMKAAINQIEPFIPRAEVVEKKKIILATVKGDVHDIGKNLVDIILSSNGYEIVNLGIKVDNPSLIKAIREHKPDAIGLSGLLIKSAKQMVLAAEDFSAENINIPLLVGGAALTKKFVEQSIGPAYKFGKTYYAKDAMQGLSIIKSIF
jgi:5-methyltetrahydrofolate--homocysteine methyltransferase